MSPFQSNYDLLPPDLKKLPDHTDLPESDGTFVKNFQEHPQSIVLTDSLKPCLDALHPDGHYAIGQDSGIYWRLIDPPERGVVAPDWYYVPDVSPLLDGQPRRSYVLWQEFVAPLVVLEFVSGSGNEERDRTPWEGKFWIYERVIRPAYYGIYEVKKAAVEVYELVRGRYSQMAPNLRGHYPLDPLGVELGIWSGSYLHQELPWLRWWDADGNLLLLGEERAALAEERASQAEERVVQVEGQLLRLTEYLRTQGIDPEQI